MDATGLQRLCAADAGGRILFDRWAAAGFDGLRNDARVLLRDKARLRVALLEVQTVSDAQSFEAVDLLRPGEGPWRLFDRSAAAVLPRFARLLTWVYPLPHYWRLAGGANRLPEIEGVLPEEVLRLTVAHLGGPAAPREAAARWLAREFPRIAAALWATAAERHRRGLANADAQWATGTAALARPEDDRPPAPRLLGPPLTHEQAEQLCAPAGEPAEEIIGLVTEISQSNTTLLEDARTLCGTVVSDEDFILLGTALVQAWRALVPRGVRAPALDLARMGRNLSHDLHRLAANQGKTEMAETLQQLTTPGGQRALLDVLTARMVELNEASPKSSRVKPEQLFVLTLVLKIVVDELDRALRAGADVPV